MNTIYYIYYTAISKNLLFPDFQNGLLDILALKRLLVTSYKFVASMQFMHRIYFRMNFHQLLNILYIDIDVTITFDVENCRSCSVFRMNCSVAYAELPMIVISHFCFDFYDFFLFFDFYDFFKQIVL